MTLAVIILVAFLVMTMLGYRFNQDDGSLVQGGLIQFVSYPSGADVFVNGSDIGSNTTAKATLSPGEHDVAMKRKGYRDWMKQIDVRAGTVTWLNYARLIPEDIAVKPIHEFERLDAALASPDNRWFALLPDSAMPNLVFADIHRDTPQLKDLALPEGSYAAPEEVVEHNFRLIKWSSNSRYVLVEHTFDEGREWLVVDRENADRTRSINAILGIDADFVEFAGNNDRVFYVLEAGNVRRVNLDETTISAPLVRDVKSFKVSPARDKMLIYETLSSEGHRSLGYFIDGNSDEPVVVRTLDVADEVAIDMEVDEYYDVTYTAIAVGNRVEILRGELPRANTVTPLKLIESFELSGEARDLSIKGSGRFIFARSGAEYITFDLEQKAQYTTKLATDQKDAQLKWLDEYMLWTDFDNQLQFYEFDGGNNQQITTIAPGYDISLARNGRYVYSIGQTESGTLVLQQARLIL